MEAEDRKVKGERLAYLRTPTAECFEPAVPSTEMLIPDIHVVYCFRPFLLPFMIPFLAYFKNGHSATQPPSLFLLYFSSHLPPTDLELV